MFKFYYVDNEVDQYQYLTLNEPDFAIMETVEEFEVTNIQTLIDALHKIEYYNMPKATKSILTLEGLPRIFQEWAIQFYTFEEN